MTTSSPTTTESTDGGSTSGEPRDAGEADASTTGDAASQLDAGPDPDESSGLDAAVTPDADVADSGAGAVDTASSAELADAGEADAQ